MKPEARAIARAGSPPAIRLSAVKLVPTRRSDYAIRSVLFLARAPGERSKAAEIAEAMEIPQGFLHQVFQELQRAQLVRSVPGRSGGDSLAREPEAISALEVIESIEGPLDDTECALRGGSCHREDVCALHGVWSSAREAFAGEMAQASIAQVAADDAALASGSRKVPANSHRTRRRSD